MLSLRRCLLSCGLAAVWFTSVLAEEPDFSKELPRIPPVPPERALDTFQVQPGYKIELVAAEPLVASPVAICWDERGRMYVVEMRGYSEHRDEGLSRVRLLHDDNNDGTYDRATVFADKLLWPTAIHCWDGGVFVADAPDILYLKDTDGNGVADVKRRVFTGFGTQNVQGLLNSFHWHLDNRIHGTASSNGGEITVVDDPGRARLPPSQEGVKKPVSVRGRDFSFDPRTLDFRAESGGAQHGMTFDDYGRKFVCSNSDHAQQVMFEDRYVARNPLLAAPSARVSIAADGPQSEVFRISPVEPWRIVRTRLRIAGAAPGPIEGGGRAAGYFTGATGITMVRGSAFVDDEMYGMIVVGDVGSNLIHRKRLKLNGVQHSAERVDKESEFVASKDNWFRPAQFANGPDGGLYVVDVYREVIEHPASLPPVIKKHLDLDSGRDRGRIYRIAPKNWRREKLARLDRMTTKELVALLNHDNAWHRETAARLIYERQDKAAVEPLKELAKPTDEVYSLGRLHALYALMGLGDLNGQIVSQAMGDTDEGVNAHAFRLAERFLDSAEVYEKVCADQSHGPGWEIDYQRAFTLGGVPLKDRVTPLLGLLRDDSDPWMRYACLNSLGEGAFDALMLLLREEQFRLDRLERPTLVALATQVARQPKRGQVTKVIEVIGKKDDRHQMELSAVVRTLDRTVRAQGSSLEAILGPENQRVLSDWKSASLNAAKEMVANEQQSIPNRVDAVLAFWVADFADIREQLLKLLDPREPRELELAAIQMLGEFSSPDVAPILVRQWRTFSPECRRAALNVLMARPERIKDLLYAVEEREIEASEVDPTHVEMLKKHRSDDIRKVATQLFGENAKRADVVEQYRPVLERPGEAARGKELFAKNCAGCHKVEEAGHELGPNLAAMKNRGPEAILLNVLDPNREVNPQYLTYVVATNDGKTLSGVIAAESANSITLKRADGQGDEVLRSDIDELKSTGLSLMPEGMERQLDQQAMSDVIAYIMSLK